MKSIQNFLVACAVTSLWGTALGAEPATRGESYVTPELATFARQRCSLRNVAGKWLFATSIGRQMLPGFPPEKDITALGTMVIKRDGSLSGTFDVTVEDTFFAPGIHYEGSVVINRDCIGTVTFVTDLGSVRTGSIAAVSRSKILGMSQDPANLWTYQVRRVGYHSRRTD